MKKMLILALIAIPFLMIKESYGQEVTTDESTVQPRWGIGFQFKNYGGITVKRYFGSGAVELIAGRFNPWRDYSIPYHHYLRVLDNVNNSYLGYESQFFPVKLQIRYLRHHQFSPLKGLSWYYGAGVQSRFAQGKYFIAERSENEVYHRKQTYVYWAIGLDAAIGLEYSFTSIPLTLFVDTGLYTEAFPRPFFVRTQTMWGARYYF